MRVAVTGGTGRLGSALVRRLEGRADAAGGLEVVGWTRAQFDLDDPGSFRAVVAAARPDVVVHAAAWTDVDGCARDPDRAMLRNGEATATLARECARIGAALVVISTNEVFDGTRLDRVGYGPTEPPSPANPYGRSKLAGEVGAAEAFSADPDRLGIVRTAWLFGAPGRPDFPQRIEAAARAAAAEGRPVRLVADEVGQPTFVPDLADAVARLVFAGCHGVHHVVNAGIASRAEWAGDVLRRLELHVATELISLDEHERPSRPPKWGVLEATVLPGEPMRDWRAAMDERMSFAASGTSAASRA
jgi:dTDP-4-dehydrorhamnose reductase